MSSPNPNQPNQQAAAPSAPSVDTRAGRGGKKEKLGGGVHSIATKITKKLVWVFGGIIFAGVFFWGIIEIAVQGPNPVVPIAGLTGHFSFDRFLLLGGILALIHPAILYVFESKRRDSIDNSIPHLIRDIADAGRSGMTLTRAIEISAERDYGPLTTEIKKLIAKISFRVPLERALQFFAVFLVTVYLLISSFFKQLANTNFGGAGAVGGVGFNFVSLPLDKITAVFLYMAMIEALFAGLVGGKMASGYLKDGLKHAILLMLICFITFVF